MLMGGIALGSFSRALRACVVGPLRVRKTSVMVVGVASATVNGLCRISRMESSDE